MNISTVIPAAVFIPLAGWKMYSRYRSAVGRQQFQPKKLWASALFFPLVYLYLASLSFGNAAGFAGLLAGGAGGAFLAMIGLRLTTFESSETGDFYRPNPYLGTGLMLVLAARIFYRFFQLSSQGLPQDPAASLGTNPVTLFIVGIILCYYALYPAGLLVRRSRPRQE